MAAQKPHGLSAAAEVLDATCNACPNVDTYRTEAECKNCGWRGEALHSKGHAKDGGNKRCPRCNVKAIQMGGYLDDVPASAGPVEPAPPDRYEALVAASRELVEAAKGVPSASWELTRARDAVSRLLASGEGEEAGAQ